MVRQPKQVSHGLSISGACWTVLMVVLWNGSSAELPAPVERCPGDGTCLLSNAYNAWPDRSVCKAASVVYPTTEEEILQAVAGAVKKNQKIKVSTTYGQGIPKTACPGSTTGLIISVKEYTAIVKIDTKKRTVTAQGGILLRNLVDAVAAAGLALLVSPAWDGLTLGGMLSTGAHGSSLFGKGGAVHEYVTGMRIVTPAPAYEGYGKVRVLGSKDEDLKAAKVSVGLLGVISTVTLQLQPAFKRSVTLNLTAEDTEMADEILRVARKEEFGEATWFPGLGQVLYRYDHRVSENAVGNGVNRYFSFQPMQQATIEKARSVVDTVEATSDRQLKCTVAEASVAKRHAAGSGYKNEGVTFTGFPVVGSQNLIMTAGGCQRIDLPQHYCPWEPRIKGLMYFEMGLALPLRNLKAFIADVQLLRAAAPKGALCDLDFYTGIYMRFVKKTSAYLGTAQNEDAAMLDITWSRGDNASLPRLDTDIFQELEQIAVFKYGARPHWGKNRNYVFEGARSRYSDLGKFLETKASFDPTGVFSSDWSDALLGLHDKTPSQFGPHCAIDGLCRCQTDAHCAPELHSFCRPGLVYAAARVCRTEVPQRGICEGSEAIGGTDTCRYRGFAFGEVCPGQVRHF